MDKFAIFSFNGNLMCFVHVLLNVLDLDSKGIEVKLVIEGESVKLVKELEETENKLFAQVKERKLVDIICKACSTKMGVLADNEKTGIPVGGDMSGHPAMSEYIQKGYQIITL